MFFDSPLFGSYELDILLKLVLAAVAGGLVGLEREKHGRPAGLRTNMLVSIGACAITIVSEAFYLKYGMHDVQSAVRLDPSRVAAQIVVGIGFLGAGVILKEGISVRGLTTAAGLWVVAGLGMAFGMGFFSLGVITTVLVLISLVFLKKLDPMIHKDRFLVLSVTAQKRMELYDEIQEIVERQKLVLSDLSSQVDVVHDEIYFQMTITQQKGRVGRELTEAILQLDGVKKVHYR